MADDPAILLRGAGEEAWHIHEGDQRYVEGIAGADEACGFGRGGDVERPGQVFRLVRDDPHRATVEAREADDDVRGEAGLHLHEFAIVDHPLDHIEDVVGLVARLRDQRVEFGIGPVRVVGRRGVGGIFEVVARQEGEERADLQVQLLLVRRREVRHAADAIVRPRAAQLLLRHRLAGHRLDHVRPGDEHLRDPLYHQDEVGHGRGVDRTAPRTARR